MKIYVAAKFEDQKRVQDVMTLLRQAGHSITYDWTQNEQISAEQAQQDQLGVFDADALVLIVEQAFNYCGALVELGMALGRGIPVYVLGNALDKRCIFMRLPNLHRGIANLI